jgi:hypothetical protein
MWQTECWILLFSLAEERMQFMKGEQPAESKKRWNMLERSRK